MKTDSINKPIQIIEELKELYILRTIACLSVILVHITAIPVAAMDTSNPLIYIFTLLNRGTKYTTATFIFISGFVFFYRYQDQVFSTLAFLKKRFKNTLIPYVIWTLIYYAYFMYEGYYGFSITFLVKNLLLANMSYHLYFILTVSQFYLLFDIFLKLFKRYNSHALILGFLLINLLSLYFNKMQYADRFFTTYVFFFALGCYLAKHYTTVRKILANNKTVLLFMYLSITFYDSYLFFSYYKLGKAINVYTVALAWFSFSAISILFLLAIANNYKSKADYWFFRRVSRSSFYIYLTHPMVILFSSKIQMKLGINSNSLQFVINTILVYSITLFLCFSYTSMKERMMVRQQYSQKTLLSSSK